MAKATADHSGAVTWVNDLGGSQVAVASTTAAVQACVIC